MEILSKIFSAKRNFISSTGKTPVFVYLGFHEINSLYEANKQDVLSVNDAPPGKQREVLGMQIYEVDAETHFGVGI